MKMNSKIASIGLTAAMLAMFPLAGDAIGKTVPRVALYESWSVYNPEKPAECFIASAPTKWVAIFKGKDVTSSTRRGDIVLYITNRPSAGVHQEVSYTGGYPFKDGSSVSLTIDGNSFELFTEGEFAWPTPDADGKIVAAMRKGMVAKIRGTSSRGKVLTDTFSLKGFTKAVEDADGRCK